METTQNENTPFTFAGTMSREQIRNYVYQLKCFLSSQETVYTHSEKERIETEITTFENIKSISKKITAL